MGKVLKAVALVGAVVAAVAVPGLGFAVGSALSGVIGATAASFVTQGLFLGLVTSALGATAGLLQKNPAVSPAQVARLDLSFNPDAARKIVFGGDTASAVDMLE